MLNPIDPRWKLIYPLSSAQLVETTPAEVYTDVVNMADPGQISLGGSRIYAEWAELRGILVGGATETVAGTLKLYRHTGPDVVGEAADWSFGRALAAFKSITIAASALADGAELITTPDFFSATGWTLGPGWAIAAGVATHTAGQSGGNGRLTTPVSITAGKVYLVAIDVDSGDTVEVWVGSQKVLTTSSTGRHYGVFKAAATGTLEFAVIRASGTTATVIDDVSINEQNPTRFHAVFPSLEGDNIGCGGFVQAGFLAAATMANTVLAMWIRRYTRY